MSVSHTTSSRPTPSSALFAAQPGRRRVPAAAVYCFSIQAEAEPGVMPRVLELFAKRNLVPSRWVSDRIGPSDGRTGGGELAIDLQVEGLTPELSDYIARCLRQIQAVKAVLTSQKALV